MADKGITDIAFKKLNGTPAMVHRETGKLLLDPEKWEQLPPAYRFFILLHEHYHTQGIKDEMEVDRRAWEMYRTRGWPAKDGVNALSKVLKRNSRKNKLRRYAQTLRAYKEQGYDVRPYLKKHPTLKKYV